MTSHCWERRLPSIVTPPTDYVDGLVVEGVCRRVHLEPLCGSTLAPARDGDEPHVVDRVLGEVMQTEGVTRTVDIPRLAAIDIIIYNVLHIL